MITYLFTITQYIVLYCIIKKLFEKEGLKVLKVKGLGNV